uniref:Tyrosine-protein phosphatase 2 n=1 Tax=Talaromyces marneffei PM1 TaxID=1077442 RepID=A0A093VET5_TALMA
MISYWPNRMTLGGKRSYAEMGASEEPKVAGVIVQRITIEPLHLVRLGRPQRPTAAPPTSTTGILDTPKSPSSSLSCPDLTSLQITSLHLDPPSPVSLNPSGDDSFSERGASRASSPTTSGPRGRSRKIAETGKKASRKALSVLNRFRALHHKSSGKMAQSAIRIDTDIHGTKRGLPHDGSEGSDYLAVTDEDQVDTQTTTIPGLPPFLNLPYTEIRKKFEDLEWLQRSRIAEGAMSKDPSHRWAIDTSPEVKARNRYQNVQAWANSRIRLKVPEGECDFINASPITLKDSRTGDETRYIATQGPKVGVHLAHFWHMVFHESADVAVIVMLTQTVEAGREKCAQYFPLDEDDAVMNFPAETDDSLASDQDTQEEEEEEQEKEIEGTSEISGSITLREHYFDEACRSEIRKLELQIGNESKVVWHFLFAGWADYSKPEGEERDALLQLLQRTAERSSSENPRIVHCSAGVGRTGTFIALDHLLRELDSGELLSPKSANEDPIYETVNQLREQRMMMVYNEMQLQFIYEVIREQSIRKLGGSLDDEMALDLRSPKVARLSSNENYTVSDKPELEPETKEDTLATEIPEQSPAVSDDE